jgi:hypothetical protein
MYAAGWVREGAGESPIPFWVFSHTEVGEMPQSNCVAFFIIRGTMESLNACEAHPIGAWNHPKM